MAESDNPKQPQGQAANPQTQPKEPLNFHVKVLVKTPDGPKPLSEWLNSLPPGGKVEFLPHQDMRQNPPKAPAFLSATEASEKTSEQQPDSEPLKGVGDLQAFVESVPGRRLTRFKLPGGEWQEFPEPEKK